MPQMWQTARITCRPTVDNMGRTSVKRRTSRICRTGVRRFRRFPPPFLQRRRGHQTQPLPCLPFNALVLLPFAIRAGLRCKPVGARGPVNVSPMWKKYVFSRAPTGYINSTQPSGPQATAAARANHSAVRRQAHPAPPTFGNSPCRAATAPAVQ